MSAPSSVSGSDLRGSDLVLGGTVALGVLVCAAALVVQLGVRPEPREPEPVAAETIVAVTPVEVKGSRASAAAAIVEPEAEPEIVEPEAEPEIVEPPPEPPLEPAIVEPTRSADAIARTDPRGRSERKSRRDEPMPAPPEPQPAPAADVTSTTGAPAGTEGTAGEGDAGSPDGSDDGEALVAAYRATLRRWLSARVRIRGTALDPADLDDKRVHLTLQIDDARTIVGATIVPTGTAAFDRAALQALTALEGQTLPAPPDGYPGPLQRRIPVVFVCKPGACD